MRVIREDARRRGVDFRAVGQEPGWLVEISQGKTMRILADYGKTEITTAAPARDVNTETGVTTYRARTVSQTVSVAVENKVCHDAMSGFPFEATVVLTLNGKTYKGCGENLKKMPSAPHP